MSIIIYINLVSLSRARAPHTPQWHLCGALGAGVCAKEGKGRRGENGRKSGQETASIYGHVGSEWRRRRRGGISGIPAMAQNVAAKLWPSMPDLLYRPTYRTVNANATKRRNL